MFETVVELVDRWFPSSKTCATCGHVQLMKLSDRIFNCQKYAHVDCRDRNAAVNLQNAPDDTVRQALSESINACGQEDANILERSRK